jgi:bla regulator protein blaR1
MTNIAAQIARNTSRRKEEGPTGSRKVLLATAALAAITLPVAIGVVNTPRLQAQSVAVATDGPAPQFEVVSIKPNKSGSTRVNLDLQPSGRFIATNVGLPGLILVAYGDQGALPGNRLSISTNAQWIGQRSEHFDIEAKAAGELTRSQLPSALRTLLADRFKLVVHHETKELPMYALVLARTDRRLGPRLRRSDVDCSDAGNTPPPAADGTPSCGFQSFPGKATGRVTMLALAQRMLSNALDDRRSVEDRTGLSGTFEFDLEWTPDRPARPRPADAPPAPPIDPNGASIFTALREQLGLKLEPEKGQIDILVVDSAERPTPD